MSFQRKLADPFVEQLNQLYQDEVSWWRTLVDDPDVFLGIRKNSLNAYAGGGSVARIGWNGRRIQLNVHTKYLVFADPGPGKGYCDVLAGEVPKALVVDSIEAYTANLRRIKKTATMLTGAERQAECSISSRLHCVLDIEAAFNPSAESLGIETSGSGRLDMVVVDDAGKVGSVELKLFSNAELRQRGGEVPAVCGQLIEYGKWLERNRQAVLAAYRVQTMLMQRLQGKFFQDRRVLHPTSLDTTPRLLIVGHDRTKSAEVRHLRDTIVAVVEEGIPGFSHNHIQAVGKWANVQPPHLLL